MALLKISPNTYETREDFSNLISYLTYHDKNPDVLTNLISTTENSIDVIAAQWCYAHKMYQPNKKRTLCYHYIIAFDLSSNMEFNAIWNHYNAIIHDIIKIPSFNGLNFFLSVHRRNNGVPEHVHILIDSLDHKTGQSTFFWREDLVTEIGEVFFIYGIAFAGYSYEKTKGRLTRGNCSPGDLYLENYFGW